MSLAPRVDLSVDEFDEYSLCIEDSPMNLQPKVLDMELNEVTLEWKIALISPGYLHFICNSVEFSSASNSMCN